jgi:hypothetical protein
MLTHRYHADLRVYAAAEHSLENALGAKFLDAFVRANRARVVFERSREQLNQHIRAHRCLEGAESLQALPRDP